MGWCNGAMQHVRVPPPVTTTGIAKHGLCRPPGPKTVYASQFWTRARSIPAFSGGRRARAGYCMAATRDAGTSPVRRPSFAITTSRHLQGIDSDESACPRAGAVTARARARRHVARTARGAAGPCALPAARASIDDRGTAQGGPGARGIGPASPGRGEPGSIRGGPVDAAAARGLPAGHVEANAQGHARGAASRVVRRARGDRVLMPRAACRPCPSRRCVPLRPRRRTFTARVHCGRCFLPSRPCTGPGWASLP